MKKKGATSSKRRAIRRMQSMGGVIRTSKVIEAGIHPRVLYELRDKGALKQISPGAFRLKGKPELSQPDLIAVVSRAPNAVICLTSALYFHNITTQIPHRVSVAIERTSRIPKFEWPPVSVHKFSSRSFSAGVEEYQIDDVTVRIYSPEKTLVDCFKYRNKIGMDVVLEALKYYKTRKTYKLDEILKYAKICRVAKIMEPYLEVIS